MQPVDRQRQRVACRRAAVAMWRARSQRSAGSGRGARARRVEQALLVVAAEAELLDGVERSGAARAAETPARRRAGRPQWHRQVRGRRLRRDPRQASALNRQRSGAASYGTRPPGASRSGRGPTAPEPARLRPRSGPGPWHGKPAGRRAPRRAGAPPSRSSVPPASGAPARPASVSTGRPASSASATVPAQRRLPFGRRQHAVIGVAVVEAVGGRQPREVCSAAMLIMAKFTTMTKPMPRRRRTTERTAMPCGPSAVDRAFIGLAHCRRAHEHRGVVGLLAGRECCAARSRASASRPPAPGRAAEHQQRGRCRCCRHRPASSAMAAGAPGCSASFHRARRRARAASARSSAGGWVLLEIFTV